MGCRKQPTCVTHGEVGEWFKPPDCGSGDSGYPREGDSGSRGSNPLLSTKTATKQSWCASHFSPPCYPCATAFLAAHEAIPFLAFCVAYPNKEICISGRLAAVPRLPGVESRCVHSVRTCSLRLLELCVPYGGNHIPQNNIPSRVISLDSIYLSSNIPDRETQSWMSESSAGRKLQPRGLSEKPRKI